MTQVSVRPITASDRIAWAQLFRGYRNFYERSHDPRIFDTVWRWLLNPDHEVRGLIAEMNGVPVGFAHYRTFARPIDGVTALFLDDMFTAPEARGSGAGTAMLARLNEIGVLERAAVVRWITAHDNTTARSLYDQIATEIPFATYDMKLEAQADSSRS